MSLPGGGEPSMAEQATNEQAHAAVMEIDEAGGDQGLDAAQLEALQKLDSYIGNGFNSIQSGWRCRVIQRKPKEDGKDSGGPRRDVYYISPAGERFRSRSEVLRHLNGEPKRPPQTDLLPARASKRLNWAFMVSVAPTAGLHSAGCSGISPGGGWQQNAG